MAGVNSSDAGILFFAQESSPARRLPGSGNTQSAVSTAKSSITRCRLPARPVLPFSLYTDLSAAAMRKMIAQLPAY